MNPASHLKLNEVNKFIQAHPQERIVLITVSWIYWFK